jgi:plasmid stabilization system protein ParE
MGPFEVRYTEPARVDLVRLLEFLLDRADNAEELDRAQHAIDAIRNAVEVQLSRSPFIFRKAGVSPFLRELVIAFGSTGYVALYEIEGRDRVNILAIRHQQEEDYH